MVGATDNVICGFVGHAKAMHHHKRVKHLPAKQKTFYCEPCDKGFFQKQCYDDHMNVHTGRKPHQCKNCSMTFG